LAKPASQSIEPTATTRSSAPATCGCTVKRPRTTKNTSKNCSRPTCAPPAPGPTRSKWWSSCTNPTPKLADGGVVVDLDHDPAGVVGEEVRLRRAADGAADGQSEVLSVPVNERRHVGHVERKVFEYHAAILRAAAGTSIGKRACWALLATQPG